MTGQLQSSSNSLLFALVMAIGLQVLTNGPAHGQDPSDKSLGLYVPDADKEDIPHFPFQRYFTRDQLGRRITFYLSKPRTKKDQSLPLVLCVQGSGSQSIFLRQGDSIASGGPEAAVLRRFSHDVRVLVVEKPGVTFLVQPKRMGSAEEASAVYQEEFSLPRWVEAVNAGLNASLKLDGIDQKRILALGHSEGGQVVCAVAAKNPAITHVACMAGGGPTQLYDLIELAREGKMYDPNASPDERVRQLKTDWEKVLREPDATDKFILGHSHLRWSSFLRSSPIESILKSKAKVFLAQGTNDTKTLPSSADIMYAELIARGRDCTYERIQGADHAFMKPGDKGAGWLATNTKAVDWFLSN